jgi:heme-degrading monooxygenase HmoA
MSRRAAMAALVRISNPGMTTEVYDDIARGVSDSLKAAAGFQFHVSYPSPEGVVVMEVWDSADQHMQWFEEPSDRTCRQERSRPTTSPSSTTS